jgi:hypothetical protein
MLDIYAMAAKTSIQPNNIEWDLLKEGMTIADDNASLEVKRIYLEILEFVKTSRYELNTEIYINNILTIENRQK